MAVQEEMGDNVTIEDLEELMEPDVASLPIASPPGPRAVLSSSSLKQSEPEICEERGAEL